MECVRPLDQEVSRVIVRNPSTFTLPLNVCYPVQAKVLSFLGRTDLRNMELAGLGLSINGSYLLGVDEMVLIGIEFGKGGRDGRSI